MSARFTRRRFLQTTAVATAGLWTLPLRASQDKTQPSEKLTVGVIGIAGQGAYNWGELTRCPVQIAALCDVHESRDQVIAARKRFPEAKFYTDFRHLIEHKGLDAVLVATPDHMHVHPTLTALRAGLHVYCEKPLTHTVQEARTVIETAAAQKRVTQMGTQIHAGGNYRRVVELIQGGAIGPVGEVHVWVGKVHAGRKLKGETPPIPAGLHWDLWQGPVPERPYHPQYVPFHWRGYWAYGGGTLADMACHYMDLPFWALKLRHPETVVAEGPPVDPDCCPPWTVVRYTFPAREELPPVRLTWYDGERRPPQFAEGKLPQWGDGVLFVGEKGMLLADYGRRMLVPEQQFKDVPPPKPMIPNSIGHHREWVEACKHGGTTTCNFNYSGALSEAVLLGTVAYRCGKPLTWDAKNLKAVGTPEAEQFLRKEYRKGWEL